MDIYPLLLCPYLELFQYNDILYIHNHVSNKYFIFCNLKETKMIKNINLICEREIVQDSSIELWKKCHERKEYLYEIFHIQTNVVAEDLCKFHEYDIEYELLNNNFLLRNEIILNYLIYKDKVIFLNNFQKQCGNLLLTNQLPIFYVDLEIILNKKKNNLNDTKLYIFDIFDLNNYIKEYKNSVDDFCIVENNILNFYKQIHNYTSNKVIQPFQQTITTQSNVKSVKKIDNNQGKNTTILVPYNSKLKDTFEYKKETIEYKKDLEYKKFFNAIEYNQLSKNISSDELNLLPTDIINPTIVLITFAWNESQILPMFLEYYGKQVDKIIYYDNYSTDDSLEIIEKWNMYNTNIVQVKMFDTNNEIRDDLLTENKNTIWKEYINEYDWVIICDVDEFLVPSQKYKSNIKNLICEQNNNLIGGIGSVGFQMINPRYNYVDIKKGTRSIKFDKTCLWNLKLLQEINYSPGCHYCEPKFIHKEIKILQGQNHMQLRHMKYVGNYDILIKRLMEYEKRLSDINKKNRWGSQYNLNEFKKTYMLYSKKSIDVTNF